MFVKIITVLVFLHVSDIQGLHISRDGKPGYKYYSEIHGSLKLHQETVEWLVARINCRNEDAVLVSPWTPEFISAVNKIQADNKTPEVYSGALEIFPDGVYTDYVEGGPTLLLDLQRCSVFYTNGTHGEVGCKEKFPYICYASGASRNMGAPSALVAPSAPYIPGVLAPIPNTPPIGLYVVK